MSLHEHLKMTRPLVVFDLETTGTNVNEDRIVEIAYSVLVERGEHARLAHVVYRINPGRHIPKDATDVHGITDFDVESCPAFSEMAQHLFSVFSGRFIAGYNIRKYDVPLLRNEFARCGIVWKIDDECILDAYEIFKAKQRHTLSDALRFYCHEEHTDAHAASGDVSATIKILDAQFEAYPDLRGPIPLLTQKLKDPTWIDAEGKVRWKGTVGVFTFGKYRGIEVREVAMTDPEYLQWLNREGVVKDLPAICDMLAEREVR